MSPIALDGPAVDGNLYTWLTGVARQAPSWLDGLISAWSTYGPALFAALMLLGWWRARKAGDPHVTATALAAPLVVTTAFLADTGIKSLVREQRPCQTLHTLTLEACPPLGDWSFPSNHAAIAAAAATVLWLLDHAARGHRGPRRAAHGPVPRLGGRALPPRRTSRPRRRRVRRLAAHPCRPPRGPAREAAGLHRAATPGRPR